MNTKQSVKCSCSSRIVLTEVEGGECQVMYYWKHEGHGEPTHEIGGLIHH